MFTTSKKLSKIVEQKFGKNVAMINVFSGLTTYGITVQFHLELYQKKFDGELNKLVNEHGYEVHFKNFNDVTVLRGKTVNTISFMACVKK